MPYVNVHKDLSTVRTKLLLNLTKRQLIGFGSAALVGLPTFFFARRYLGTDISGIIMITTMLPFFFVALYEKNGLPFEKILKNIILTKFVRSKIRPYKTQNLYNFLGNKNITGGNIVFEQNQNKQRKKKHKSKQHR